jgi:hypothetical protein
VDEDHLEVRVIGGVTGWENLGERAVETIVWGCLAFSILSADMVLQRQEFRRSRPVRSRVPDGCDLGREHGPPVDGLE